MIAWLVKIAAGRFGPWVLGSALAGCLALAGAGGFMWLQLHWCGERVELLLTEQGRLQGEVTSCGATIDRLLEDIELQNHAIAELKSAAVDRKMAAERAVEDELDRPAPAVDVNAEDYNRWMRQLTCLIARCSE